MIKPVEERYDEFLKDTEKIISVFHPKISDVDIKSMAMDITNRTLVGYRTVDTNVKYDKKPLDKLKVSFEKLSKQNTEI